MEENKLRVNVRSFLVRVEEIATEEPAYRKGGCGNDGTCDCIGLIIGAIRRAGGSWTGLHGTNYAARNEVRSLQPITGNPDLRIGEIVFKARSPGDRGYDAETLNGRYRNSPDRKDYCHVGVVEAVYPLRIRHMTSPRPKLDTRLTGWTHHGWLQKIIPEGEEESMEEKIYVYGGVKTSPVHLRNRAGLKGLILADVPQGAEAVLLEYGDFWSRIRFGNRTGWMMTKFIHREEPEAPDSEEEPT